MTEVKRTEERVILREASNEADMKKKLLERWAEEKVSMTEQEALDTLRKQYSHNQRERETLASRAILYTAQDPGTQEEANKVKSEVERTDAILHRELPKMIQEPTSRLKGRVKISGS